MSESFIHVHLFDPAGNITALVTTATDAAQRRAVADAIQRTHPEVEQVGFVRFSEGGNCDAFLQMTGGEFCGNAALCTAALCAMQVAETDDGTKKETIRLRVSGTEEIVEVHLRSGGQKAWDAEITMPREKAVCKERFSYAEDSDFLPVVRMEGITHVLVFPDSPFFSLRQTPAEAERAIRHWAAEQKAEGFGLLFLTEEDPIHTMTPLVYIPGSGTLFWENACASGSAAVGIYLAAEGGKPVEATLRQPGGDLRVLCAPGAPVRLRGTVSFLCDLELSL